MTGRRTICEFDNRSMIDLHAHLLPSIDDGADTIETALKMARIAVDDGITHMACTPHVTPGVYDNTKPDILKRIAALQQRLDEESINLWLLAGADIHVAPHLDERFRRGEIPTLNETRYFLFEPPHHVRLPGLVQFAGVLIRAGYYPIVTHPERLSWIEQHYQTVLDLKKAGCLIQVTAGAVTGRFGSRVKYWSERMLDEGIVDVIATDAHDPRRRPPIMSEARDAIAARHDDELALKVTEGMPLKILADKDLAA